MIQKWLFKLARTQVGHWLVRVMFTYFSNLLPVHKVVETDYLVAFYHPRPSYVFHLLVMPKKAYANFLELPAADPFLGELTEVVQKLVKQFNLEPAGYRLIVNGGAFQDIPQLHFHLVSGPVVS
jgi:histidine triad (HIT) family protein